MQRKGLDGGGWLAVTTFEGNKLEEMKKEEVGWGESQGGK